MTGGTFALLGSKMVCLQVLRAALTADIVPVRVMTLDDSGDTRSQLAELESLCARASVPFSIATSTAGAYAELLSESPSVVIVAGWYRIIPDHVLARPERGFYGIHYSLLPRFRGSAPVVWAILAGEDFVGFSLFRLTANMDEGEVVLSGQVPAADRYVGDVLDDLNRAAPPAIARALPAIMNGTADARYQDAQDVSYCGVRGPSDGLLDWKQPAHVLARAVRAQSRPYPGAFARLPGGRVRIWRAEVEAGATYFGVHGQCVRAIEGDPVFAAGQNTGLRLTEFELEPDSDGHSDPLKLRINSRLY